MAPFPPEATCVLPMSAHEYYAIQYQPSFRALFASVSEPSMGIPANYCALLACSTQTLSFHPVHELLCSRCNVQCSVTLQLLPCA